MLLRPFGVSALNRALVLFDDDPDVVGAAREFSQLAKTQAANNQELVKLFRAICRNLRISEDMITDDDFIIAFNAHSDPVEVVLNVQEVNDGTHPRFVIFGFRPSQQMPVSVTLLDSASMHLLIAELKRNLESAQARYHQQGI